MVFGLMVMQERDKGCKDLGDGISDRKVFEENGRCKRKVKKDGKGSVKQGGQVGSRPTGDAGKSFGKKFGKRQEKRRRKFFGREKIEQREGREGKLPNQKRNRKK